MKKITAQASSDVALIKYWGKKDEVLRLPENGSLSLILAGLDTMTTVEFDTSLSEDEVIIMGESEKDEVKRVSGHLDRIRKLAKAQVFARVKSTNTFPKGTGLSSSGSGFAALTVAATKALDLQLSQKELSILARQGSGTACRCVCGGVVEWKDGDTSETSYSESVFEPHYWDLRDVVVVVDEGRKKVSSTQGHMTAQTSIAFGERQKRIAKKLVMTKKLFEERNFAGLGELVEREALEFHSILLTSDPPMIAWYPGTVQVMHEVQRMRGEGVPAYFTINTGFNVHVLTLPNFEMQVKERMESLSLVQKTLTARIGGAPTLVETHLF